MKLVSRRDLYVLAVLATMEVVGRIPSASLAGRLVHAIGELAHLASRGKRAETARALEATFGQELTEDERARIARRAFHEFWRESYSLTPWGRRRLADSRVEVRGLEHLERAIRDGRGAVLWESAYFGQRHLGKWILLERGWRVDQVHLFAHAAGFGGGAANWTWIAEHVVKTRVDRYEAEATADLITLRQSESLAFTRVLRDRLLRNRVLAVTADVAFGRNFVACPFLGGTGRFPTGMISLSRATGAPLLPLFCVEEPEGRVTLTIGPPIEGPADASRDAYQQTVIATYAARLEWEIRQHPGCYRKWDRLASAGWEPKEHQ